MLRFRLKKRYKIVMCVVSLVKIMNCCIRLSFVFLLYLANWEKQFSKMDKFGCYQNRTNMKSSALLNIKSIGGQYTNYYFIFLNYKKIRNSVFKNEQVNQN